MTDVIDPIIVFLIVLLVSVAFVTIGCVSVLLDRRRKRLQTQLAASGNQTTNDAELGLIYDKLWYPWRNYRHNRDEVIDLDNPAQCSPPAAAHRDKRLSQAGTLRASSPSLGFDKDVGGGADYYYRPQSPYKSKETVVSGDAAGYYGGTSPSPRWGEETFGKGDVVVGKYEMDSSVERQRERERQRQNTLWPEEDSDDEKEGERKEEEEEEERRRPQFQWADVPL
ncbi:hypothetical protein QBC46DRAFT_335948 [Diplogelasinospora grovesii]|uniref:Uncharacterized protein n=1 Tax=Diplogelasinospora grovesii TaxID=303347 RepID=A0AAN6NLE4_9PEZI|nr:hypothetical protein QBC46DRAFT_335948 [Diplogelasinospora grovesii]